MKPEYESLLALKNYLSKPAAKKLVTMIKNEENLDKINRFVNIEITKKQIHKSNPDNKDYKEYENELNKEEKLWVKKFYAEYYDGGVYSVPKDKRLLNTEEMVKEANRRNYSGQNDIYDVSEKTGLLAEYNDGRAHFDLEDPDMDWETVYKYTSYNLAADFLMNECIGELKIKILDKKLTLARFYIKMDLLRKAHQRDKRNFHEPKNTDT